MTTTTTAKKEQPEITSTSEKATKPAGLTYTKKNIAPSIKAWAKSKTGEEKQAAKTSAALVEMVEKLAANCDGLSTATKGALKPLRGYIISEASKLYDDENSIKATASKVITVARHLVASDFDTVQQAYLKTGETGTASVDNLAKAIRKPATVKDASEKAKDSKAASGLSGCMAKLTTGEIESATMKDVVNIKGMLAMDDAKKIQSIVSQFTSLDAKGREACMQALAKVKTV